MDYQLKKIIKEVKKGKNLKETIPQYADWFMNIYQRDALQHLAMSYYIFYEVLLDKEPESVSEIKKSEGTLSSIVEDIFIKREHSLQENVKILFVLREEITKKMKILTTYTDRMQIYEHVLNRMELRYQENLVLSNQEQFIEYTMGYIFGSKDNMLTNIRIRDVIAELPVRMARSKYYQLIKNSIGIFKDAEKTALEGFMYHLESAAMLYEPEEMTSYFSRLHEFLQKLEKTKFQEMTQETYEAFQKEFMQYTELCMDLIDLYMGIQEIVNYLLVYAMSMQFKQTEEDQEIKACREIIETVCRSFQSGNNEELPKELEDRLTEMEGMQEDLEQECEELEALLYDVRTIRKELVSQLQLEEKLDTLYRMEQLMGTSLFAELDEPENTDQKVTQEQLDEAAKTFLKRIAQVFEKNERCVNRAIMASTFAQMPPFFATAEEVREYIEQSLEQCTDAAERQASMNIIQSIMKEEM